MKWLGFLRITDGNWITNLALWVILLLPIIVYADIAYPFEFGRFLIFMFVLPVLFFGILIERRWQATRAWWRSPLLWLTLLWLAVCWLSAIFGVNFYRSFWGTVARSTSLLYVSGLAVLFISLLMVIRRMEHWLKILAIMSWVGGISAAVAILQKLGIALIYRMSIGERVGGLIGNPIFFGMFLLLTFFLAVYFFLRGRGWVRWLSLVNILLQATAIILTVSRGPFLGWIVGLLIFGLGWLYLKRPSKKQLWGVGGLIALFGVMVGGVLIWLPMGQRLLQIGLNNVTVQTRLLTWSINWQAFLARPWLGYGWENVENAFNKFYQSGLDVFGIGQTIVDRAHNFFFDQLLINGAIGAVVMLIWIVVCMILLVRRLANDARQTNNHSILVLTLLATGGAYLVSQFTAFDVVMTLLYGFLLLGVTVFLTSPSLIQPVNIHWLRLFPLILILPILLLDIRYLAPAFPAAKYSVLGDRAYKTGHYSVAAQSYNRAQNYPNPYLYFLLIKFPSFSRVYAINLINQQEYASAEGYIYNGLNVLDKIIQLNPDNPGRLLEKPISYMLLFFIHADQPQYLERARTEFDSLIKANPNRGYLYLNWTRVLIDFDLFDEAYASLNRAANMTSPPRELEFWRAILGIRSGWASSAEILADLRQATNRTIELMTGDQPTLKLAVNYLIGAGDLLTAEYYQAEIVDIVQVVSEEVTERVALATIYANLGKFDLAEEQAREVLKLDPKQAEAVEEFLQSIGRSL